MIASCTNYVRSVEKSLQSLIRLVCVYGKNVNTVLGLVSIKVKSVTRLRRVLERKLVNLCEMKTTLIGKRRQITEWFTIGLNRTMDNLTNVNSVKRKNRVSGLLLGEGNTNVKGKTFYDSVSNVIEDMISVKDIKVNQNALTVERN